MMITLAHGSGGKMTDSLIRDCFAKYLSNSVLDKMEDAAVVDLPGNRIAFTTDSFVVTPLFFPGGDIGRLSVCGTVNDLLMRGAKPRYLSAGFILETGLDTDVLERVVRSMAETAAEAGVSVVAGDTKVIEGNGGLYINTAGVGEVMPSVQVGAGRSRPGDAIILSGFLGDHEACILSQRMKIENRIQSDCAPLTRMTESLWKHDIEIHAMRDVTRGGLATILNELAASSGNGFELFTDAVPMNGQVQGFCDILGLDLLYMGNEGKMTLTVPQNQAEKAVQLIRSCRYGENAAVIGRVYQSERPSVTMKTRSGATRSIPPLLGEGLPRIC